MSAAKPRATTQTTEAVLAYLQHRVPAYPFDPKIDAEFVRELIEDFADIDILEETKGFRWFYCQQPPQQRTARLSLRRWLANATRRRSSVQTSGARGS